MLSPRPITDPILRAPDLAAAAGKAWLADLQPIRDRTGVEDATLCAWVIEAPWAHPVWHSYCLILVHLRPMPDGRETLFYLKGATHEISLWAMDPERDRNALLSGDEFQGQLLRPANFASQFIADDDAAALAKVSAVVMRVVEGRLSPDTDYVRHWANLFGANMLRRGAGETRIVVQGAEGATEIVIPSHPGPQNLH